MTAPVPQKTEEWLKTATPDEIVAAQAAGELAELQGQPIPTRLVTTAG